MAEKQSNDRGFIVVTGTSTGIGAGTVTHLVSIGFHVFAGVRREDIVVFGSPTWWLTTCMPVRSYLHSPAAKSVLNGKPFAAVSVSRRYYKGNVGDIRKLGEQVGGKWAGSTHFVSDGNQVMSMASWLVFMRKNKPRSRYFGVPLPRPNLKGDYAEQAKSYASELTDKVFGHATVDGRVEG